MAELVDILNALTALDGETSLADHLGLMSRDHDLAPNYKFAQWINKNKYQWTYLLTWLRKVPADASMVLADVAYHYGEREAQGLGLTDVHRGLCVSANADSQWHRDSVPVTRTSIADEDIRDGVPGERQIDIPHCAHIEHITTHLDWWCPPHQRYPVVEQGRRLHHARFGLFVECLQARRFYSVDRARHGGSAFKRFTEQADGLYWDADVDADGNDIDGKHKGDMGRFIARNELYGG
jgi:hypothetical protein